MKLSYTFMIIFLVIGTIGSLVFVTHSAELTRESLKNELENKLREQADLKVKQLENFLDEQEKIFYETFDEELFAKLLTLSPEEDEYDKVFQLVQAKLDSSSANSAGVTKSPGIMVANKDRTMIGRDISSSFGVQRSLEGSRDLYSSTIPGNTPSTLLLGQGRSVFDKNGTVVGAAGMQLPLDELKEIVGPMPTIGKTAESYLINEELLLLTPSLFLRGENKGVLVQVVDTDNSKNCFDETFLGQAHAQTEELTIIIPFLDYRGEVVFGTLREVSKIGWCLLIEVDKEDSIDAPLKEQIENNIFVSLAFVVILTLIGFFIGNYFDKKNKRRKSKKYPCGAGEKSQPWYCRWLGGKCATYPLGRCGRVVKARKFFVNLKLRHSILIALIFVVGYFFLVTSFFQGWENAALYDEISDLSAVFVLILLFFHGFKLRTHSARLFIQSGCLLAIFDKLVQIVLEEYIFAHGIISAFYWIPGAVIGFIGLFLIFFGFKELFK